MINQELSQLRTEADGKISQFQAEVVDLAKIIEEANGYWYQDLELCTCTSKAFIEQHDHYLNNCKINYKKLRDSDGKFCYDMFHGLQKDCAEVILELDTKITMKLWKFNRKF